MATVVEKFLGQVTNIDLSSEPNGVELVAGSASLKVITKNIIVCNTGNTDATFSVHFISDGSSATTANATFFEQSVRAKSTVQIDTYLVLESTIYSVIARTDFPALTYTAFGVTVTT